MKRDDDRRRFRLMTRRELLAAAAGATVAQGCARFLGHRSASWNELICCGWDEVFILDVRGDGDVRARKVWTWKAADCPDLPEELRDKFRSTDECKPIDRGRRIMITSSSNGCAVVERETKRAVFWASVVNAHSIELLPKRRLVVAASVSSGPGGNRLVLFDMDKPGVELFSTELKSAHGVVWDLWRDTLWALGSDELRAYRLRDWDTDSPKLERRAAWPLPDKGGHDLSPVLESSCLYLTTNNNCWLFNRAREHFVPSPFLRDAQRVKSFSQHPIESRMVYIQAEGDNWWAENIHFLYPEATLHLPGERLYKARWNAQG